MSSKVTQRKWDADANVVAYKCGWTCPSVLQPATVPQHLAPTVSHNTWPLRVFTVWIFRAALIRGGLL